MPIDAASRANFAEFSSICLAVAYDVCANRDLFALFSARLVYFTLAGAFPDLASWARIDGSHNGPTSCGHAVTRRTLPLEGRVCTVDCEPAEAIPEEDIVENDQAVAAKRHAHQDGDEQVGLWFRRWIVPHRLWRRQLALWRRRHGRRPAPRAAHDRPSDCAKQRRAGHVRADAGFWRSERAMVDARARRSAPLGGSVSAAGFVVLLSED